MLHCKCIQSLISLDIVKKANTNVPAFKIPDIITLFLFNL